MGSEFDDDPRRYLHYLHSAPVKGVGVDLFVDTVWVGHCETGKSEKDVYFTIHQL